MTHFTGLAIFIVNVVMMHACNVSCPKNKPYCSDVGCVFECLDPFFIKGTDCVIDCGYLFVDQNRHCIETCPAGTFFMETLKLINAKQHLEKKCLTCDVTEGFIQDNECVKSCPDNWKFIEDKNHAECLQECPDNSSFITIIPRFGVLHSQCVSECLDPLYTNDTYCVTNCGQFFIDQNRNCIDNCPSGTFTKGKNCVPCDGYDDFLLNNTCITFCPENWMYTQEGNHKKCVQQCPSQSPFALVHVGYVPMCVANCDEMCVSHCSNNKVRSGWFCVDYCPVSAPYKYNGNCNSECTILSAMKLIIDNFTCVEICPVARPYILNNHCVENCPALISINKDCVEKCHDNEVSLNNSCLEVCPPPTVTFNNTCMEKCPDGSNLSCRTKRGTQCGSYPGVDEGHTVCVSHCPSKMFVWNNTCVHQFSNGFPSFEQKCTEKCPAHRPYLQTYVKKDTACLSLCVAFEICKCTDVCMGDTYMYNDTCSLSCPPPLVQFEKICLTECPGNAPLQINKSIDLMIDDNTFSGIIRMLRVNFSDCVSSCGNSYLQLGLTCVEKCPETSPYVHNRICKNVNCTTQYVEFSNYGIICKDDCDGYIFEYNNTCYKRCPLQLMVYNQKCVTKCPDSHRYILLSTYCNNCISKDREVPTYTNCNVCFPKDLEVQNECLERCPKGYFTKDNVCVKVCEPPLFTFQTKCLITCPISSPYINASTVEVYVWKNNSTYLPIKLTLIKQEIQSCVSFCPSNKALNDGICTASCPAHAKFIKNQTCSNEACDNKYQLLPLGTICVEECPKNTFQYDKECTKQCPGYHKVYDSACVPNCPHEAQFTNDEPLDTDVCKVNKYSAYFSPTFTKGLNHNYKETKCTKVLNHMCIKECPAEKFIYGNKCVSRCLHNHFILGNTCVETCPDSDKFIEPKIVQVFEWVEETERLRNGELVWFYKLTYDSQQKCVNSCNKGYYHFGNSTTCVDKCKEPLPLSLNGVCVGLCPAGTLLDRSRKMCVDRCFNDTALYNDSCYSSCPEHVRFIYNFKCTSKCPDNAPYALKNDRNTCKKSCEDGKLFKDGDCIRNYLCDGPFFEFAGACINRCPTGFVWFVSCNSLQTVYVSLGCLALLLISVLICCGQFLWYFFQVAAYKRYLKGRLEDMQHQMWCKELSGSDDVDTFSGIVFKEQSTIKPKMI